jgi:hypothetical protein
VPSRKRIVTITVVVWIILVLWFEVGRMWFALNGPPGPEYYTRSLSFQLAASAFLVATRWLPVLLIVIMVELIATARTSDSGESNTRRSVVGVPPNKSLERTRER